MEKLLELLRATRLKNGISQDYLAVKLGVSSSSVSRWESKGNFPSVDKLFEYAELWGFTLQEVLALNANAPIEVPKPVGKIEISAYDKASFKRLVAQLLEEGDGNIEFVTTHMKRPLYGTRGDPGLFHLRMFLIFSVFIDKTVV